MKLPVLRDDHGAAVLEFVALGVALLVPIAYALGALVHLHVQRVTAQSAAAATALAIARTGSVAKAPSVAAGHWSDGTRPVVQVRCHPGCSTPGAVVWARVRVDVTVAGWADVVAVDADSRQVVDRFAAH